MLNCLISYFGITEGEEEVGNKNPCCTGGKTGSGNIPGMRDIWRIYIPFLLQRQQTNVQRKSSRGRLSFSPPQMEQVGPCQP